MKFKRYPVLVWFLDEDMQRSAAMLTNKHLVKTISGCLQCLLSARFYFIGFRSAKFYKHYFDKVRKAETMDKYFPLWPLKMKPSYQGYNSKEGKWCRKCLEHYTFISNYLDVLLDEYMFRYGKEHGLAKFAEWNKIDAPALNIPAGNLKKVVLPWKVLNPKYRKADILAGYRLQYKHMLEKDGGVKLQDYAKRDVPEFLTRENAKWLE